MAIKDPTLLKLDVPVIVELGRRQLHLKEILELAPGSIIELPKKVEEELDLYVANKQVGNGTAVKIGENFGIQVSFVGDVRSRLEAATSFTLGADDSDDDDGINPEDLADQLLSGQI